LLRETCEDQTKEWYHVLHHNYTYILLYYPAFWTDFWTATKRMITAPIPPAFPAVPGIAVSGLHMRWSQQRAKISDHLWTNLKNPQTRTSATSPRAQAKDGDPFGVECASSSCFSSATGNSWPVGHDGKLGSAGSGVPVHLMALEPGKHRHHYTVPYYAINPTKHHDSYDYDTILHHT